MKNEKELSRLLKDEHEEAIKIIFDNYYEELCLYATCQGIIPYPV